MTQRTTKQRQNRPKHRAKHGSPRYSKQFGFWCTKTMHRQIMMHGGSDFVRKAIKAQLQFGQPT